MKLFPVIATTPALGLWGLAQAAEEHKGRGHDGKAVDLTGATGSPPPMPCDRARAR